MNVDLRIAERDWLRLRKQFEVSFRSSLAPETGALAVLGECRTGRKHEFIVSQILLPEPGELKLASNGALIFDASFVRRAHIAMRKAGLAGIATFHTHPGAAANVEFSPYDNHQNPLLAANLMELEPRTRLVSVVAGKHSQCAQLFSTPHSRIAMRRLTVVGDRLSFLPFTGKAPPPPPPPAAAFDRALALTAAGALAMLAQMTIVVVGASGTGSLICELLARAGCRRIILIDHDVVRVINLNRILYATAKDARLRVPKVEVIRRGIEGLGLGVHVEPVWGSILDFNVLRRVLDADFVFGCVDRALPRHLLCELSARYAFPYIDVGSEIGGDDDGIVSLDGRTSYIAPGRHCLMCTGVVTPRRLHFESLTEGERKRQIALGYSDDLLLKQPAVMELNMRPASNGVLLLRHLLQPFLREPLPVALTENAVTYRMIPVSKARAANSTCPTCQVNPHYGHGDCGPQIGFDADTEKKILGNELAIERHDGAHDKGRPRRPSFMQRAFSRIGRILRSE